MGYAITRSNAVTCGKALVWCYEQNSAVTKEFTVDGAYDSTAAIAARLDKGGYYAPDKVLSVTNYDTHIQLRGMTAEDWMANSEVISDNVVSAEEAANFKKRKTAADND